MDKQAIPLGSVRKQTRRHGRHNTGSSQRVDDDSGQLEDEVKPLKHQISFLLNRGGGTSSVPHNELSRQGPQNMMGMDGGTREAVMYRSDRKMFGEPWSDINAFHNNGRVVHTRANDDVSRRSSSERRRTCEQCGKIFAQPADLKKHIKCVHLKERPFQCDECDAAFGEKGNLNRHKKSVHNKERPWVCSQCGLPFAFRDTLTRHVRAVHQDIRPFACPYCQSAFKKRDHLHRHQEALHGIRKR